MESKQDTKKEDYKVSFSGKEPLNIEQILKKVEEQNLIIKTLKEELKKAPWEKQSDSIRH